jgi:hypothetical protein
VQRLPRARLALNGAEHEHERPDDREHEADQRDATPDGTRRRTQDLVRGERVSRLMRAHSCPPAGAGAAESAGAALGGVAGLAYGTGRVGAVTECVGTAGPFSPGWPAGSVDTGAPRRPWRPRR